MGKHYIPQQHLRNFEDPRRPGFVWLHDKCDQTAKIAKINKVAQSKGFYSQETEDRLAREVEIPGNRAIAKLIGGARLSTTEREHLSIYIGTMFKRIPRSRRKTAEMMPKLMDEWIKGIRAEFQVLAQDRELDQAMVAGRLGEIEAIHARYSLKLPQDLIDKVNEPWPSDVIIQTISNMTWRVLATAGPNFFITTDNPAFFFEGYGLANEFAELSFPLSSTHVLHGSWQGSRRNTLHMFIPQECVKEINKRLASGVERFAFYHERNGRLLDDLSERNPYLSRITW